MQSNESVEQRLLGQKPLRLTVQPVDMPQTLAKLRHLRSSYLLYKLRQAFTSTPLQHGRHPTIA